MAHVLKVHFLPELTTEEALAGAAVVVIDVLRASTTIAYALAAGAREVIPCLEVDEARTVAAKYPPGEALLGGERGGLPIEGFDFGNSPTEYTRQRVEGRTVVFTTTNGTKAMQRCRRANRVFIGSFVNLSAVAQTLGSESSIHLLCAGTRGEITREDVLFAGSLAARLTDDADATAWTFNDQALLAIAAWRQVLQGREPNATEPGLFSRVAAALRDTQGGRNLQRIGLAADIEIAADVDRYTLVPELDLDRWRICSK